MNLLRRRTMMQTEEVFDENVVYVYDGYLDNTTKVDSEPIANDSYPDSVCTSAFFMAKGTDTLNAVCTSTSGTILTTSTIFRYTEDGAYRDKIQQGPLTNHVNYMASLYYRFLFPQGVGSVDSIAVTHSDGTTTNYKIIDRRRLKY